MIVSFLNEAAGMTGYFDLIGIGLLNRIVKNVLY